MHSEDYVKSLNIYYCGSEICEKKHCFGPAVRTHYLLHFIVSGKGEYKVNGKTFTLYKGEGFIIKPGELTLYEADSKDPWTYMWVAFDGYEARYLLNKCNIDYVMKCKDYELFLSDFKNLIAVYNKQDSNIYERMSYFYKLISQLVTNEKNQFGSYDKIYFEKACDYMYNNFMYSVTVAQTATFVGIDRTYLYKVFEKNSGISPKKFLTEIKINAAKNMIKEKAFTLNQIALSCGFVDSATLCKQFKLVTGKTPKQFKIEIETTL